jgi:hypothetical protein
MEGVQPCTDASVHYEIVHANPHAAQDRAIDAHLEFHWTTGHAFEIGLQLSLLVVRHGHNHSDLRDLSHRLQGSRVEIGTEAGPALAFDSLHIVYAQIDHEEVT